SYMALVPLIQPPIM
ncbi:sodium ion-translocating decarboxylase subunit beta, partial [Klebsiella pneumoniae]